MAVITTGGSGDWNSATPNAPWPGGTKPTTSDTVVIASGHTVTVSTSESTWGTSPASASAAATTTDVVLTITGTLTIQSTGTLTVRGSVNGTGTLNNNSTTGLIFDASSAGTPGSQNYSIKMTGGSVNATGAAGARALFTSNDATGGRGFFNSGAYATNLTYVRCYKLGKPGAPGTHITVFNAGAMGNSTWDHVEWDTCSRLDGTVGAAINVNWSYVTIKSSTTTTTAPFNLRLAFTRATTGTRIFNNICLDEGAVFNTDNKDLTVNGFFIGASMDIAWQIKQTSTLTNSVSVQNVLLYSGNASGNDGFRMEAGGTFSNVYSLTGAFHTAQFYNTTSGVTWNCDNWIIEADGGTNGADALVPRLNTLGNAATINLTNSITLPNLAPAGTTGRGSGSLLAGVTNYAGDYSVNITHCTQFVDANTSQGGTYLTESSTGVCGGRVLDDFRSNLFWCDSSATGYAAIYQNGTPRGTVPKRLVDDSTYAGTITGVTATTMTVTGGAVKWTDGSAAAALFSNLVSYGRGVQAWVRITSGATAPQIAAITGQSSSTTLTVASWPNGTPSIGDAWEIYVPNQADGTKLDYNAFYRQGATGTLYTHNAAGTATAANKRYRDLFLDDPTLVDVHSVDLGSSGTEMTSGPQFVDSTRNSLTWQTSKGVGGGSPTQTTLMQEMLKCNDDSGRVLTGTLSENIADLVAYVKAGFAPQNSALATAAHDGTTIGAVAYASSGGSGGSVGMGGVASIMRHRDRAHMRSR